MKIYVWGLISAGLLLVTNSVYSQAVTLDLSGDFTINGNNGMLWWDYQYRPAGTSVFTSSGTVTNSVNSIEMLNPFLSWEFRIRQYDFYGQAGSWGAIHTVNSEYLSISKSVGYNFNFDTSSLNEGWRGYRVQNNDLSIQSNLFESGYIKNGSIGNSMYMSWLYDTEMMLVSPKITDLAADKKFSIYAQGDQGTYPIILGTITDPYNPGTFHPLKTVYITGSGFQKVEVFMNNYIGQDQYIAIKSSGNHGDVSIDDFSYEQSFNCFDLKDISISNVQEHTAQLNFTDLNQAECEVSLKDLRSGLTEIFKTSSNPFSLYNLAGNTDYEIKIRANCNIGLYSNWSQVVNFKTICETVTAGYSTSFLETNYIDPCWKTTTNVPSINQFSANQTTLFSPRTGTKMIYVDVVATAVSQTPAQKAYLVTPYISDLSNNKRIQFYLISKSKGLEYNAGSIAIGTMSNPSDETTFVSLKTILPAEMNEIGVFHKNGFWKQHIVYLDNYDSSLNHHYIALKFIPTAIGSTFVVDDFAYENKPLCKEPTNLNLILTDFDKASVKWDDYDSATNEWEIEYGSKGFIKGSGSLVNVASNPFTISGLTDNTEYDFYVRTKCGTDNSNWSDRGCFKTRCFGVIDGYAIDFENDDFETKSTCWRRLTPQIFEKSWSESSFIAINTIYQYGETAFPAHSGKRSIMFRNRINSSDTSITQKTVLVSPRLTDFNNSKRISFWLYCKGYDQNRFKGFVIGTLSNPDDYTTFTPFKEISSSIVFDTWVKYTVDFSGYSGTDKYVGFKHLGTNGDCNIYIDDFMYYGVDCNTPTSLKASQSGENQVLLSWSDNSVQGTVLSWEVEYGPLGYTPGTGTVITVNSNPFSLEGLTKFSKYEFRVRNSCFNEAFGDWSSKCPFKVSCSASSPFNENFDQYQASNYSNFQIPNFCWTTYDFMYSGVSSNYKLNNIISQPNVGYIEGTSASNMLISPYLSDFDNDKRIKFWVNNNMVSESKYLNLIIGTMSNPLDEKTFEPYQTFKMSEVGLSGKEIDVDFSQYLGSNKHIVFKAEVIGSVSGNPKKIFIDNIYYDEVPTCYEPIDIKFQNIKNNSVEIKWTGTGSFQNVQIEYGMSGFALGTGVVKTANVNEISITDLQASKAYDFYFKTICSSGQSVLVGPKRIDTPCESPAMPWIETLSNLPQYGNKIVPGCFKTVIGNSNFDLKNTSQSVYTNYFNNDHKLNGYNDSSYLYFYNAYYSGLYTPGFNLNAGVTYKFSIKARKAYEYGSIGVNCSVIRGQEDYYKESVLTPVGYLSEYQYNGLDFYFTPITSGNYSYLLEFISGGGTSYLLDNFELKEGYASKISTNNENFDFQSGNNDKLILEAPQDTTVLIISDSNNFQNKVVMMSGSATSSLWLDSPANPNGKGAIQNDIWVNNQQFVTKINMKVDASLMNSLVMDFDLKQTFNVVNDESRFRVVVNGILIGDEIKPSTKNLDAFKTLHYDLTSFVGQDIAISLQHIGKSNLNGGDRAYIDNIMFNSKSSLGVNEGGFNGLKVYPNPTDDILKIENNETISKVQILNLSGQLLYDIDRDDKYIELNLSGYSDGIYFVKVFSDEKNKVIKILKR